MIIEYYAQDKQSTGQVKDLHIVLSVGNFFFENQNALSSVFSRHTFSEKRNKGLKTHNDITKDIMTLLHSFN